MRRMAVLIACATVLACAPRQSQPVSTLKDNNEKVSYILGLQMGKSLKEQGLTVTPAIVVQGLNDAASGNKPLLTDDQIRDVMTAIQTELMSKQRTKDSAVALTNTKEGEDYLAANKSKSGVKTTASGLQYKVLKAGTGPKPTAASTVSVNYRGTLINGEEFDKSGDQPVTFPLTRVIPGWTEGLQLMNVGSKFEFVIPGNLAYGQSGSPPKIGPNATLIFEVELLSIK